MPANIEAKTHSILQVQVHTKSDQNAFNKYMAGVLCFAALGRLEKHCQWAGSRHCPAARARKRNTTSPLNIEGGRQFESSSEKEVDSFFPNMNAGQNCSQLLVRSRQGFPADRPALLGVVAGRHCLAGGNLSNGCARWLSLSLKLIRLRNQAVIHPTRKQQSHPRPKYNK